MGVTRRHRILALGAAILLLAFVTAGCARRGGADGGSPAGPIATLAADAATPSPSIEATSPTVSTPGPSASPVPTPDLSAVDGLLNSTDTDLNADASAGPDEGTTP